MGKSIIIKKENGQIAEVEKIKRSNFIPYFTKKDKCFENILSQEDIIKLPSKEKSEIIRKAKSITNELNAHCSLNETSNIIKKINEAKTEEELLQIVNDILKQYYLIPLSFYTSTIVNDILKQNHLIPLSLYTSTKKITKNKVNNNVKYIEKSLINNKKATISIMIKEMIMTYYTNLLLRLPERTIRELENKKITEINSGKFANIAYNDTDIICTFLGNLVTRLLQLVEFIVILISFYLVNYKIFIFAFIIIVLMLVFQIYAGKELQEYNKNKKKLLDEKIIQDLEMQEQIRNKEINAISEINNITTTKYLESNYKFNVMSQGIIYLVLFIIDLSRYGIIFYAITLTKQNLIDISAIVLIYTYYSKIITNFETIGTTNIEYRNYKVSIERVKRIIET